MVLKNLKLTFASILIFVGMFIAITNIQPVGHSLTIAKIMGFGLILPTLLGIIFSLTKNNVLKKTGKIIILVVSIFYLVTFIATIIEGYFEVINETIKNLILIIGILLSIITLIFSIFKENDLQNKSQSISKARVKTLTGNILLCCLFSMIGIVSFVFILQFVNIVHLFNPGQSDILFGVVGAIIFAFIFFPASIMGLIFTIANFSSYKCSNEVYKANRKNIIFSFVCALITAVCSLLFGYLGLLAIAGLVTGAVLIILDYFSVVKENNDSKEVKEIEQEQFEIQLANLYKLKKSGALTDEEYNKLKKKLIEKNFK